jgi:hypothetical protein
MKNKAAITYVHNGVLTENLKANALQSISQAMAMNSIVKTTYISFIDKKFLRSDLQILEPYKESLDMVLIPYGGKFSWLPFILKVLKIKGHYYTRSWLVAILVNLCTNSCVFESHGKQLTKSVLLDNVIFSLLRSTKVVCISESLERFIVGKGILNTFVLHDAVSDLFISRCEDARKRKDNSKPREIQELQKYTNRIACYVGKVSEDRGIKYIEDLARDFQNVGFIVIGDNSSYLKRQLPNLKWVGYVDNLKIPFFLVHSDVLLMLWTSKVKTIEVCSPLKYFEYSFINRAIAGFWFPFMDELVQTSNMFLSSAENYDGLKNSFRSALKVAETSISEFNYTIDTYEKRAAKIWRLIEI